MRDQLHCGRDEEGIKNKFEIFVGNLNFSAETSNSNRFAEVFRNSFSVRNVCAIMPCKSYLKLFGKLSKIISAAKSLAIS